MRQVTALLACAVAFGCGAPTDHPWLTDPGVGGHGRYLPLLGTAHDPTLPGSTVSCDGCHPGSTFREYACVTCHEAATTDPVHAGQPEYPAGAATSADCYRCHPQGNGLAPGDHGRYFPIGSAAHPAVCTLCHTDAANRSDPSRLACVACHERQSGFATAHAPVKDYPIAIGPEWCLRCHADSQVDRIDAHGQQQGPPGRGGPGDGEHDTHCFTCHTMVPPLFGGAGAGVADRPWAQDWGQASCSRCH